MAPKAPVWQEEGCVVGWVPGELPGHLLLWTWVSSLFALALDRSA